jgi:heavy metal-binding protein
MKKLILLAACLGFMASGAIAQTSGAAGTKSTTATATAKYYCPKCMKASDKAGTCPHCYAKLVKEGDYYCPGCGASSAKPGKCTACKKDMVKMTGKKA